MLRWHVAFLVMYARDVMHVNVNRWYASCRMSLRRLLGLAPQWMLPALGAETSDALIGIAFLTSAPLKARMKRDQVPQLPATPEAAPGATGPPGAGAAAGGGPGLMVPPFPDFPDIEEALAADGIMPRSPSSMRDPSFRLTFEDHSKNNLIFYLSAKHGAGSAEDWFEDAKKAAPAGQPVSATQALFVEYCTDVIEDWAQRAQADARSAHKAEAKAVREGKGRDGVVASLQIAKVRAEGGDEAAARALQTAIDARRFYEELLRGMPAAVPLEQPHPEIPPAAAPPAPPPAHQHGDEQQEEDAAEPGQGNPKRARTAT